MKKDWEVIHSFLFSFLWIGFVQYGMESGGVFNGFGAGRGYLWVRRLARSSGQRRGYLWRGSRKVEWFIMRITRAG